MNLSWYNALNKVHDARRSQPQKIPLIFYRTAAGSEPVREWLKGLDEAERQAIGKDLPGAMAVAGRDAAVPPVGKWAVGGPNGPADETDGTGAALPLPRAPGRVARVHQENASHAG